MNPADRKFLLKRAVLRALADCAGFPALESAVREAASIKVDYLRASVVELDEVLREAEADRLFLARMSERGRKLKLTEAGQFWLDDNP